MISVLFQVVGAVGFAGEDLPLPEGLDDVVVDIIQKCWRRNAHERPSFSGLLKMLAPLKGLRLVEPEAAL